MINIIEGLSLDDIMLIPKYSTVKSRDEIDISIKLVKDFQFALPYTPSNMATICELDMAKLMHQHKSLAVFHRFIEFDKQLNWLEEVKSWQDGLRYIGFSIGIKNQEYEHVDKLIECGAQIIVIDVAHGFSTRCLEMTKYISSKYPHILLISGNSADGDGARAIWKAGADICKNSVGSGSICLTRIATGVGVVSATSLSHCYDTKISLERELNRKLFLMQDGGCAVAGQVCKALCFADLVMLGNMFSATLQTPGQIIEIENSGIITKYKKYVGSSTHKNGAYKEGVEALKKYKGDAQFVINTLNDGIRSCCSYQGVYNTNDLKIDPRFVKISGAGLKESGAHDLDIIIN